MATWCQPRPRRVGAVADRSTRHVSFAFFHPPNLQAHTSIFVFSLLALSKSPVLIPFATSPHSFLLSNSPISPLVSPPITVTSSFAVVTSWNVWPFLYLPFPGPELTVLVVCHRPSITYGVCNFGEETVALNVCDLPVK